MLATDPSHARIHEVQPLELHFKAPSSQVECRHVLTHEKPGSLMALSDDRLTFAGLGGCVEGLELQLPMWVAS